MLEEDTYCWVVLTTRCLFAERAYYKGSELSCSGKKKTFRGWWCSKGSMWPEERNEGGKTADRGREFWREEPVFME